METPLISIIVPCYNVEEYLPKCVDSLLGQTYRNIEIFLVDDGSPDRCGQLCDEYAAKDSRIRVIHKENGGLVSARNAGYDIARGEWFTFLDSDDWLDLDTFEKLIEQVNKYPNLDMIFWISQQELNGKTVTGKWQWDLNEYTHSYQGKENLELARRVLDYKYGIAASYDKLIKTSYAKRTGLKHDDRLRQGMEGEEFALRSFYYASNTLYIKQRFYHYRYNPTSITKIVSEKNSEYNTQSLKVIEEDISNFKEPSFYKQTLLNRTAITIVSMAMNTYFTPQNCEQYIVRRNKFITLLNGYSLYIEAIKSVKPKSIGSLRGIALFCIQHKIFIGVELIGRAKYFLVKMGYFGY